MHHTMDELASRCNRQLFSERVLARTVAKKTKKQKQAEAEEAFSERARCGEEEGHLLSTACYAPYPINMHEKHEQHIANQTST